MSSVKDLLVPRTVLVTPMVTVGVICFQSIAALVCGFLVPYRHNDSSGLSSCREIKLALDNKVMLGCLHDNCPAAITHVSISDLARGHLLRRDFRLDW